MTLMERRRGMMGASNAGGNILGAFPRIMDLAVDISLAEFEGNKVTLDLTGKDLELGQQLFKNKLPVTDAEIVIKCNTITLNGSEVFSFNGKDCKSITFVCNQDYLSVRRVFTGGTGSNKNCLEFYGLPLYVVSAAAGNYGPFGRANFRHADFVENVTTGVFYLGQCSLLDDSTCISVANALNAGSPDTVTFHATPKARLASIMGRVESVTSGEETYNRFVQDDSGSVSLQDFITTTKGWTLG